MLSKRILFPGNKRRRPNLTYHYTYRLNFVSRLGEKSVLLPCYGLHENWFDLRFSSAINLIVRNRLGIPPVDFCRRCESEEEQKETVLLSSCYEEAEAVGFLNNIFLQNTNLWNYITSLSWSLKSWNQAYDLGSHITYVVCGHFIYEWRDLEFKVDPERQIFFETFYWKFN